MARIYAVEIFARGVRFLRVRQKGGFFLIHMKLTKKGSGRGLVGRRF